MATEGCNGRDGVNVKALAYMLPQREQTHITENYVSSPPALIIVDEANNVFTLGFQQMAGPRGEYGFPVLLNGQPTGEVASRIERRNGKIRIFTETGFKRWTGRGFV
jgi:hypothetical protein